MDASVLSIAYQLIYAGCEPEPGRFTNDLPISSEVWLLYASDFQKGKYDREQSLLLTPHNAVGVAALRVAVLEALTEFPGQKASGIAAERRRYLAINESHVQATIVFFDLLALLPLTRWWETYIQNKLLLQSTAAYGGTGGRQVNDARLSARIADTLESTKVVDWVAGNVLKYLTPTTIGTFKQLGLNAAQHWFPMEPLARQEAIARLVNVASLYVGLTLLGMTGNPRPAVRRLIRREAGRVLKALASCLRRNGVPVTGQAFATRKSPLWQVSHNRPAEHAIYASRKTVKADAAIRVFDTGGQGMRWAIIDSGIDARHPAFADPALAPDAKALDDKGRLPPSSSRVTLTLDFTRLALITSGRLTPGLKESLDKLDTPGEDLFARMDRVERDLANGRMIDWATIEPLLRVDHSSQYEAPVDSHGTHVAGIIGANWRSAFYQKAGLEVPTDLVDAADIVGICPRIEVMDLRVFSKETGADEFAILAALQYVRYLNQSKDLQYVHGINLSLSLRHDVRNYACGSTPVCLECDRLVGGGVLVVAAAGNYGYDEDYGRDHLGGAYRGQSITDPGNAAAVLTVGATHRTDPYQYGISYFSSHGPTGDGRNKPDLVAPGEKIVSTIPDGRAAAMDGTSMAAPHVSGIAALVLARNRELIGQPERLKKLLCESASDLGRNSAFQGAGLADALRVLQAI